MNPKELFDRLLALPWANQWRLLAGTGFLVAGLAALALWAFSPDYAPLYPSLPEREAGGVITALEQAGYTVQLAPTGAVMVERSKIHEARYKLAAQGLPKSTAGEAAVVEAPKFGASSLQEGAWRQRTLEMELSKSISTISGISSARVHLALPRQTVFGKETTAASASVVVEVGASGLSKNQAGAIAHLVASSIPGMEAGKVSIVDEKGRLLTGSESNQNSSPEQRQQIEELRQNYQQRIQRLLEPISGKDGSRAEVDVDLEFGDEEIMTETWRPNVGEAAVRSQKIEEQKSGAGGPSGVPGSATNFPPVSLPPLPGSPASPAKAGAPAPAIESSGRRDSVVNYELDRSVVKSIKRGVKIKKVKAAVLLNHKKSVGKDGKPSQVAFTPDEIIQMQSLVKEAIGYQEDRGDSVELINMPFVVEAAEDSSFPWWKNPAIVDPGLQLAKWLGIFLFAVYALRQIRSLLSSAMPKPPEPEEPVESALASGLPGADPAEPVSQTAQTLEQIKATAQSNPQAVAGVIKDWVGGENE